jgi:type IV pilus assembly protein PilY1
MRRTHHLLLSTLLGASLAAPASAQSGGPLDANSVRPAVMLMVDTSGSMERLPDDGSNPSCDSCVPSCTGNTLVDRNNKTRWALTIEALTGTIQNYACVSEDRSGSGYATTDYDYGYYLPHINFNPDNSLSQATDGILDSFATRVKFGLMTFDGVGTTINGDTLVQYSQFFTNNTMISASNGPSGMYSYGSVGRLAFPGCDRDYGINAGSRNENAPAGGLIRIPAGDSVSESVDVANRIQESLLAVRPFGGTPIAGMLEDLRYFFETDANVSRTGDTFFACRKRKAVLITDGAPDAMFRDDRFRCHIEEDPQNPDQKIATPVAACDRAVNTLITVAGQAESPSNLPRFESGGCSCPYKSPQRIASELTGRAQGYSALLEKLIVVAYNVHDTNALSTLNSIGEAAGFTPADRDTTYPNLVIADGAGELRAKIDEELNATQPGVTSRSVPVSVSVGDPSISGSSKRFDITAGFQVGVNTSDPWRGFLYRGRAECNGTDVVDRAYSAGAGDVFHETLTTQSAANQRALITVTPRTFGPVDGSLINDDYQPRVVQSGDSGYGGYSDLPAGWTTLNERRPDGTSFTSSDRSRVDATPIASQGTVNRELNPMDVNSPNFIDTSALNPLYFGDANDDNVPGTTADRTALVNHAYGRGRPNALADIFHSQPVVMVPVNATNISRLTTIDARYSSWLRTLISSGRYQTGGRPGVVFVGTNDGVLHAFNLDDWNNGGSTVGAGRELWGFVPPALFGKMASMLGPHQIGFDGSPQVRDVILLKRPNQQPIYRTILVSAVSGAHAYVALDVTHPEDPIFLWQFSAPDVGNTVGNIGLTQVKINWPSDGEMVRAVAILPGGEGVECAGSVTPVVGKTRAEYPRGNSRDVRCWNRRGRAMYVVDVATGQLIQEFGFEHFPSPMTGSVAVDSAGLSPASAAYSFDEDGVLWRLSMVSSNPQNWKAAPIYDMFADPPTPRTAIPAYRLGHRPRFPPTLTRNRQGSLVILAGTGDVDSPFEDARHRIISLTEHRRALQDGEISSEMELNWRVDLQPWEGVTGPLTLFQDSVYFATFRAASNTNQCALGSSYRWGAHAYDPVDRNASPPAPLPRLRGSNANATDPLLLSELYNDDSLVLGMTVRQQPICASSSRTYNATTQQSTPNSAAGGGGFQLVGVMSGGSSGGDGSRGGLLQSTPQTIQAVYSSKVTSWTSMFE